MDSTTIRAALYEQMAGGLSTAGSLADVLLLVFNAGVHLGAGEECPPHPSPTTAALLDTLRARWRAEMWAHQRASGTQ